MERIVEKMNCKKKLSIIVPVYNTEYGLDRCLGKLEGQTYKNIEVIVINDDSNGNCEDIITKYKDKYNDFKYIIHNNYKGLAYSRLEGIKESSGDYITFLNSDSYVSIDYYRTLMNNIEENDSDIAMGKTVFQYENGSMETYNLFDCKHHFKFIGNEIFELYFSQRGLSSDWSAMWNKVYKREIWEKVIENIEENQLERIDSILENVLFSTILMYFAKKITYTQNDVVFHCKGHEARCTRSEMIKKSYQKKFSDVDITFKLIEDFLKKENIYSKYEQQCSEWKSIFYINIGKEINKLNFREKDRKKIKKILKKLSGANCAQTLNEEFIYRIKTPWNGGLEEIKYAICDSKIKCISFDVFDTLIQRPFYYPTDLFDFLNEYFMELNDNRAGLNFKKIRIDSEQYARKERAKIDNIYQDITIDEIYQVMEEVYGIDKLVLEKLKQRELELEMRFCERRNVGFELYELAVSQGKRVIVTSDMYLSKDFISNMLLKNGYNQIDNVYVSSESRLSKALGNLYEFVLRQEQINPEEMLHLGDNYTSDYLNPQKYNINSRFLVKALDIANDSWSVNNLLGVFNNNLPTWKDNTSALSFLGIRTMISVFANKYFDNPFVTYNKETDFNADPYLIGYFALGMCLFGVSKWLLDDSVENKYDNIVFMARDGYLPMETYKIMKKLYKNAPKEKYLFISRKALIPVILKSRLDFYKLSETTNIYNNTPNDILEYIGSTIDADKSKIKKLCRVNEINLDEKFKDIFAFNRFIKILVDNFYNEEKIRNNQQKYSEYFLKIFEGNSASFDIGYSARPELYLSQLCGKPIDTYFFNINGDEGLMHSKVGGFKLKRFFNGKPAITGFSYETLISALAPSCIKYDVTGDEVVPVFEKYDKTYCEEFVVDIMQRATIQFVQDMVDKFEKDVDILYMENYYVSLPIMAYINSSKKIDRKIFDDIYFEDDVGVKKRISLNKLIEDEMERKNQASLDSLININQRPIEDGRDVLKK